MDFYGFAIGFVIEMKKSVVWGKYKVRRVGWVGKKKETDHISGLFVCYTKRIAWAMSSKIASLSNGLSSSTEYFEAKSASTSS